MVRREVFEWIQAGRKTIELRRGRAKGGDQAVFQCGRSMLRGSIVSKVEGTLSELLNARARHRYFQGRASGDSTITLKIFPGQSSVSLGGPGNPIKGYPCLISDDPFPRIPASVVPSVLNELNRPGIQVILTLNTAHDAKTIQTNAHVISLEYLHAH